MVNLKLEPDKILGVDSLTVTERVLLFCVASDTDPVLAGVTSATQNATVKNLIERDQDGRLALTVLGRGVLLSLLKLNPED